MVEETLASEAVVGAAPDAPPDAPPLARTRRKTSFAGDVLKLVGGTTIAQAIGVLVAPLLTRLYAPEAFGILAVFGSITGIFGVVACLRYELAIMLPETDEEAARKRGWAMARQKARVCRPATQRLFIGALWNQDQL